MLTSRCICSLFWMIGSLVPLACSSGSLHPGSPGTDAGGGATGAQLADYAGSWDGHAEAFSFGPDGSDRVRLTVDAAGHGTLQVGEGTLAPATDPNVEYPPGITELGSQASAAWEGFPYPTHGTRVEAGRLQLGIAVNDIFASWCALQTPVFRGEGYYGPDAGLQPIYGCAPNWGTGGSGLPDGGPDAGPQCALFPPDGGTPEPIDCGKMLLCTQTFVCTCTAAACTNHPAPAGLVPAQYDVSLDAGLDAGNASLTGTLVLSGQRVTVRLTRQ